jgi:hypothetical protein
MTDIRDEERSGTATTIDPGNAIATMINVFTVDPTKQRELVDRLIIATETIRLHQGFISVNLHASHDGTKVVNYVQWSTLEDFQRMLADPLAIDEMTACAALAERFEPHTYQVEVIRHV